MKLEFLDDISNGGKFKNVAINQLIRLFDFDKFEAAEFRQVINRKRRKCRPSQFEFY